MGTIRCGHIGMNNRHLHISKRPKPQWLKFDALFCSWKNNEKQKKGT